MNLHRTLAIYRERGDLARRTAAQSARGFLNTKVSIGEISNRVLDEIDKWPQTLRNSELNFDWREIKRRHREPNRLEVAVWAEDQLCAVALCLMKATAIELRFLEGSPSPNCPLRGKRALVVLETASNFAQGCGRREIWVQPINQDVAELYVGVYGFSKETPAGRSPYFRKEV